MEACKTKDTVCCRWVYKGPFGDVAKKVGTEQLEEILK